MKRILLVGLPRSGSTWVATMLGNAANVTMVSEPDNHLMVPFALRAKLRLGRGIFPAVASDNQSADYERLWRQAFGADGSSYDRLESTRRVTARALMEALPEDQIRRAFRTGPSSLALIHLVARIAIPERPRETREAVLVKSVYAPLSVEWIAQRVDAQVVVLLRDVRNVVSSWVQLGWVGSLEDDELGASDWQALDDVRRRHGLGPPPLAPPIARLAWFLALLNVALEDASARNPDWILVRHEDMCGDPRRAFRELASSLGLQWMTSDDALVARSNRQGNAFDLRRIATDLPDAWRSRLEPEEIAVLEDVLEPFPLRSKASD